MKIPKTVASLLRALSGFVISALLSAFATLPLASLWQRIYHFLQRGLDESLRGPSPLVLFASSHRALIAGLVGIVLLVVVWMRVRGYLQRRKSRHFQWLAEAPTRSAYRNQESERQASWRLYGEPWAMAAAPSAPPPKSSCLPLVGLLVGVLALVLATPVLIIYLQLGPRGYKRATQVFALLVCLGIAILYYLRYPHTLPSMADKVTFFSGVTLSPPTVLEFVLKD